MPGERFAPSLPGAVGQSQQTTTECYELDELRRRAQSAQSVAGNVVKFSDTGGTLADSGYPTTNLGQHSRQILTAASGTYTTPANCKAIIIRCFGGGGGAGGYGELFLASPAASYAYVCGAKGTGGAAGSNAGNAGASTTFNVSTVVASGGGGGDQGYPSATSVVFSIGGAPGVGSGTGVTTGSGSAGGGGFAISAQGMCGGCGGNSLVGRGGVTAITVSVATGPVGTGYSSGGGGGAQYQSAAGAAGGDGTAGCIIVDEYY